ncbi:MAG: LamG domain-containing protein, partial [Planctomycetota bacterium]
EPNHDVYLDSNSNDVAQATRASHGDVQYYSENQDSSEYAVPGSLLPGTTYYWRVDEVDNADPCVWETVIIWSFTTEGANAYDPDPSDGGSGENPADVVLSWTPSCVATAQQVVYFSTDFNDVNTMQPGAIEDTVSATDNNCPVGALATYTNYYWRVKTDTGGNGEVWTFRTGYGGLLMKYSFEGSLGADIAEPVTDDTGKITFNRHEGGGTLKYGAGRFTGTSAVFDSEVGLYRPDPAGPNEPDYLRLDGPEFSIHFWLMPTYLSGFDMDDLQLIGKSEDTWAIRIHDPGLGDGANNQYRVWHTGDDTSTDSDTAIENEWVHIAVVYDKPDLDIYFNGIRDDGMSRPNPCPADNNHPVSIGCRVAQNASYSCDQFFDGFIDELKVWDIAVLPALEVSTDPSPPHLEDRLDPCDSNNTVLTWTPGPFADQHDVYFGTDANVVYQDTVDGNMYPEVGNLVLEDGKTYYWRVDDVNGGDTYEGFLWIFSTAALIVDPNMIVWYKFDETYGDDVMDSSGYYNHGEIDNLDDNTWDPCDGRFPGCIHFHEDERVDLDDDVFDYLGESISISVWWKEAWREEDDNNRFCAFGDGDLHMVVRAPDAQGDPGVLWQAGNDTNDVLEWATDGLTWKDDWHHLVFTKNGPEGTMKIYFDTFLVALNLDANSTSLSQAAAAAQDGFRIGAGWSSSNDFAGKADDFRVYDYEIPQSKIDGLFRGGDVGYAWAPLPIDSAVDVPRDANLTWKPGDYTVDHNVYFGTDWDDVNDMTEPCSVQDACEYDPGRLELDTTYYWRIDEVNDPCVWRGPIWRFTVAEFVILDDFERYDSGDYRIYYTWYDQRSQEYPTATGSWLGLATPPTYPVHLGEQAMSYQFDNADPWADVSYSDACLPLDEING